MAQKKSWRIETDPELKWLRRELIAIDPALRKELQRANKEAVRPIAEDARVRYSKLYNEPTGASSLTIRPLASQTRAQVAMGKDREPQLFGQEFGGDQPQFPAWRGNQRRAGYFFYPAVREGADELLKRYRDEILPGVTRKAFPETVAVI